jgi:hypothetical protein
MRNCWAAGVGLNLIVWNTLGVFGQQILHQYRMNIYIVSAPKNYNIHAMTDTRKIAGINFKLDLLN